jgi:NADPH:quinone reductase-like Zn-dependent oxidoreductase
LAAVLELAVSGFLTLPVAARFALRDARESLALSESGHVRGKIVLLVE